MLSITLNDFKELFNLHWVDWDGAYGNQCEDLAQFWNKILGGSPFTGATADLIYNQPQNIYTQVPNQPDNFPLAGDIIVWNWPHVAIVLSADVNSITVLEQNDPTNGSCQVKTYNYNGVIGWLHPNQLPQDQQSALSACLTQHDELVAKCDQQSATIDTLNQATKDKDSQIATLNSKVASLESQVTDLQTSLSSKTPIAEQLPQCQAELEQANTDIKGLNLQINSLNKTVSGLSGTSYKKVNTRVLINELIKRALQKLGLA